MPRLSTLDTDAMDNLRPFVIMLISRPILALIAYIVMAMNGWWLASPVVIWFLYGSTLAAVHHLLHGGLGLTPRWRHIWLTVLGCIVVESGHALLATHSMHHRDGTNEPDPEGYIENLTWAQTPLGALKFRYRLALWGWRNSPRRRRIGAEIGFHVAMYVLGFALLPVTNSVLTYLFLVHIGALIFAALQGKGPQANFGREMSSPLLFVHTRLLALVLFNHHQHLEHHAYPKVPMSRLSKLTHIVEEALADEDVLHLHLA